MIDKNINNLNEFIQNQYLTLEELNKINWEKRERLIKYAFNNIPFYNKRFKENGIKFEDLGDIEIWEKIPMLTKKDIVDNFNEICKPNLQKDDYVVSTTGGSTGVPVKVLHDLKLSNSSLLLDRMLSWWDVNQSDDIGRIWRYGELPKKYFVTELIKILAKKYIWTKKNHVIALDASFLDRKSILYFLKIWNIVKPPLLSGYVGAVYTVAEYIQKHKIKIHFPKAIWLTAAPVSNLQRELIEKVFNAPVYDQYGSCEINYLAAECKCHEGLHMFQDAKHIEFVNDQNMLCSPEQYGRILVTDLYNEVFPLIRYEIGDIGRSLSHKCKCGINLPLMDSVKGRISEIVKLKDGTSISGEYLTTIFDNYTDSVSAFQIWQKSNYDIAIRVVLKDNSKNTLQALYDVQNNLKVKFKNSLIVEIIEVDEILSDRGKTRYIVSDVK